MPFYLAHAGTKLYKVGTDGSAMELALPSGVTISDGRRGRFAILDRTIVMVNAPSRPIQIDPNLVVRILTPQAPSSAPTVGSSGSGSFTGTWLYVVTHVIRDGTAIIAESPASAEASVTATAKAQFDLTSIPVSTDPNVNGRRIWRTTVGGSEVFYLVTTINDNSTTTYTDTTTDAALEVNTVLGDDLGEPTGNTNTAERFEIMTAWKDRLWALGTLYPDRAFFSGNLRPWAWSPDNYVIAKPAGQDLEGGTAFAPRRDELGIGKRRALWKVIGDDEDTFQMIRVAEATGIWAPDTVRIIRDEAYFLGEDGVYKWGPGGLTNISEERVHSWFTTDGFFNRALFPLAFAKWNQRFNTYELHLAAAGSSSIDRWVSFDLRDKKWLGPHKTGAFTPTAAGEIEDDDGIVTPVMGGSNGKIYKQNQSAFTDDGTAIDFDVTSKRHSQGVPNRTKYWANLYVFNKAEPSGTLTITPRVGGLEASDQAAISHNLTLSREKLRILGNGQYCQLRFRNNENAQGVELYGYEIDPVSDLGIR